MLIVRKVHNEHKCQRMKFPHAVRCWVLAFNNNCSRSHLLTSQALLLHFETPSFCRTAPSNFRSVPKALVYTTHLMYKPVRYEIARSHGILLIAKNIFRCGFFPQGLECKTTRHHPIMRLKINIPPVWGYDWMEFKTQG